MEDNILGRPFVSSDCFGALFRCEDRTTLPSLAMVDRGIGGVVACR